MHGSRERLELARLGARSAARDLLRLVRALNAHDIDLAALDDEHREALESCNHELATTLSEVEEIDDKGGVGGPDPVLPASGGRSPHLAISPDVPAPAPDPEAAETSLARVESSLAETRARLTATRSAILDKLERRRRVQVMEAMLAIEVVDEDLEVETIPPVSEEELAAARQRAHRRVASRRRGEARRRRVEALAIDLAAQATQLYGRLPRPWLVAIFRTIGLVGHPTPTATARYLRDGRALAKLVAGLRRTERAALEALVTADGIMLARALEARFGDATEDGFEWHREPPTSVVGRLRARGLCVVGRAAVGPNPRSRPRVVVVPADLRQPLAEALRDTQPPPPVDRVIAAEVIDEVMDEDAPDADAEAEGIRFEREQPELAAFAAAVADCVSPAVGPGPLLYYVSRIHVLFEAAHPGLVPRLREAQVEAARRGSHQDLEAVDVMHERLLERRVATIISIQPNLYAYLAGVLDELPWSEADKLLVFHACDTALRAFTAAL